MQILRKDGVLLFLVLLQAYSSSGESNPTVTIDDGTMRGSTHKLLDGGEYYSFKGIPYAQPPIGDLRFRDPLPPKAWNEELDATKHGSVCVQLDIMNKFVKTGSEDCLFLNVYTKSLETKAKLPVMVFIHGGSFMAGSGNSDYYGPEFLLQHDVIVVTINYRLEVLGFLSLDTPEVPGNAGMKDQVAALKWVQHNIVKFGGDADNVTIFGESAGAASVTHHLVSPMSKGLFNKAIAQSGTCISDWAIGSVDIDRAFRVGSVLGKECDNKDELLNFLRSIPESDFAGLTFKTLTKDDIFVKPIPIFFYPVIEKQSKHEESFLNEHPLANLVSRKVNKVPLMIGYNSAEGLTFVSEQKMQVINNITKYLVPQEFTSRNSDEKCEKIGQRIKKFYVGDKSFCNETVEEYVKYLSDFSMSYNILRFAHFYAANELPVYSYRFNFDTDLNLIKTIRDMKHLKGAAHADDLFYLFYNTYNSDIYKNNDKLKEMVSKMTKIWTDFGNTGDPTPDDHHGVKWEPMNSDQKVMNLEEPLSMGPNPDEERLKFWNDLYCESEVPCIKS